MQNLRDRIWVIDDDEQLTDILTLTLETYGYEIQVSSNHEQASALLLSFEKTRDFSAILLDLRLADQSGLTLLPRIREELPEVPILMITAHGDLDSAVSAFTLGANAYLQKPFEEGELKDKLAHAIEQYHLHQAVRQLREQNPADLETLSAPSALIPSRDPVMNALLQRTLMAAQVISNCVIHGESGTGKELVARALHLLSPRRSGPFIAFNCAALPESLMESELFGHVRGAFTDAKESKQGLFTRANGGTLFLDEVGDAPLSIQSKLLRVLQEREVLPLGAQAPLKVDVRVVAATHKCLKTEVTEKRFRQDLYYRLHVLRLDIPPLRDRQKDILFLATLFGNKLSAAMEIPFMGFTELAKQEMKNYAWPGNVRELQNRIEQALALGGGGTLSCRHLFPENENLPQETQCDLPELLPSYQEAKSTFERNYLERILATTKGNIAKAARLASKSRTEVYGLLRKHGLNPLNFKKA